MRSARPRGAKREDAGGFDSCSLPNLLVVLLTVKAALFALSNDDVQEPPNQHGLDVE